MAHPFTVRHHDAYTLLEIESSNYFPIAAFQNLDHRAFLAAAAVGSGAASQDSIAVKQLAHFPGIEEKVARSIVWNEKTKTLAVTLHPTRQQAHVIRQAEYAAAIADDLTIPAHGYEATAQGFYVLITAELQMISDSVQANGLADRLHFLKNQFTAGYRIGVLIRFALGKGIFGLTGSWH